MSDRAKQDAEMSLKTRRRAFKVRIDGNHDPLWHPKGIVLRITTNGLQWETLGLLPHEVDQVIEALQKWRAKHPAPPARQPGG